MESPALDRRVPALVVAAVVAALVVVAACAPAPGPPYPSMPSGRFSTPVLTNDDLDIWWGEQYSTATEVDGDVVPLLVDVAAPRGLTGPTPAIVLIHGGGFAFGSRGDTRNAAATYARRGFVVASIDYRLDPLASSSDERYYAAAFAAIDDGMEAVRWLKANAGRFHIDTDRIALVGTSAGGAVALAVGTMDDPTPGGPLAAHDTDIAAAVSTGASLTPAIGPDGVTFESTDAPALMFHHVVDGATGFTAAYSYQTCEGLVAAGVACRFITQPNRGHTTSIEAGGPWWESEIGPFLWAHLRLASVA